MACGNSSSGRWVSPFGTASCMAMRRMRPAWRGNPLGGVAQERKTGVGQQRVVAARDFQRMRDEAREARAQ